MALLPLTEPAMLPSRPARPTPRRSWLRIALAAQQLQHGSLGQLIGRHPRQQLTWLGLLAAPLLLPVAIPGMATTVGAFCLLVALSVGLARPFPLPAWLGRRHVPHALHGPLHRVLHRLAGLLGRISQPRLLALSGPRWRWLNGGMLALAGASMMTPMPLVSFDNVVPAAAIALLAWGLRVRDGGLLLAGYVATVLAWLYVGLLWWAGAEILLWLAQRLPAGWL
ncbi:MAG: exopolysaccharide biosynthesis protein [Vogesella sp.]|uniref:exopolysaccharide biosynthesis protein n=1 Tax=Vogesella sp. TaxID=1904252 RepID=UPI003F380F4A